MKSKIVLLLILIFSTSIISLSSEIPNAIPYCPSDSPICQVRQDWTLDELVDRVGQLDSGEGGGFVSQHGVTFVYRQSQSQFTQVSATLPYYDPIEMQNISDTDWWFATIEVEGVEKAILTFGIAETDFRNTRFVYAIYTWRGQVASPPPEVNDPLHGTYSVLPFLSPALEEVRMVHLYLPPHHDPSETYPVIYMTDGQMLHDYAGIADFLITEGSIPAFIIIAVEAASFDGTRNLRKEDYVPGVNEQRFQKHMRFFTQELRLWAEQTLGASSHRDEQILFGVSNGGLFTIAMTVRHPELYGTIFPFSSGSTQSFKDIVIDKDRLQFPLRVYTTAGTLEKNFYQTTLKFVEAYEQAGAEVIFTSQVSTHDNAMWLVEFVKALEWVFE